MGHPTPVSAEPEGRFFNTYPQGMAFVVQRVKVTGFFSDKWISWIRVKFKCLLMLFTALALAP